MEGASRGRPETSGRPPAAQRFRSAFAMATPTNVLLTTVEVAELLRVHPKHVYRLLKKGLPARRVGSEWRFDRGDVLVWSGGSAPAQEPLVPAASTARVPPALVAGNGDVALMSLLRL